MATSIRIITKKMPATHYVCVGRLNSGVGRAVQEDMLLVQQSEHILDVTSAQNADPHLATIDSSHYPLIIP